MDMSNSYSWWVRTNFPEADIVFDHFHVIKSMNEISSLKWADVVFDERQPVIIAPASITKNKQRAICPLRLELAAMLKSYKKDNCTEKDLVFGRFPAFWQMKHYWLEAGIPANPGSGYDFHSLRVTFGTLLASSHAGPRTIQHAMRHSTSQLTECIYTDYGSLDIRSAVDALPEFLASEPSAIEPETGAEIRAQRKVRQPQKNSGIVSFEESGEKVVNDNAYAKKLKTCDKKEWRRARSQIANPV